jgi:hypothetical protein
MVSVYGQNAVFSGTDNVNSLASGDVLAVPARIGYLFLTNDEQYRTTGMHLASVCERGQHRTLWKVASKRPCLSVLRHWQLTAYQLTVIH